MFATRLASSDWIAATKFNHLVRNPPVIAIALRAFILILGVITCDIREIISSELISYWFGAQILSVGPTSQCHVLPQGLDGPHISVRECCLPALATSPHNAPQA